MQSKYVICTRQSLPIYKARYLLYTELKSSYRLNYKTEIDDIDSVDNDV